MARYRKTWPKKVAEMVANGLTVAEQCSQLGISRDSYYKMRKRYPEFDDAIMAAKEDFCDDIENTLYKRASGYEYEETTVTEVIDENGNPTGKKKRTTVKKHMPGDPRLIKYILGQRLPDQWREKNEIDVNVRDIRVIPPELDN